VDPGVGEIIINKFLLFLFMSIPSSDWSERWWQFIGRLSNYRRAPLKDEQTVIKQCPLIIMSQYAHSVRRKLQLIHHLETTKSFD
jgi:hypothetical protein